MWYSENSWLPFSPVSCTTLKIIFISLIVLKLFQILTTRQCKSMKCLIGKTAIVTGGSSGLGFETALVLASRGCRVIIADKNPSQKPKEDIITRTNNTNVEIKYLDLASLKSVRKFATEINETESRLDILINNAGVAAVGNRYTEDGLHATMQINHFGSFLLTHLLVDLLKKSSPSRIVFTASVAAVTATLTRKNLNYPENHWNNLLLHFIIYSNSKLCNVISAKGFNKRLKKFGVTAYSVHPGVVNTSIYETSSESIKSNFGLTVFLRFIYNSFGKTPHEGAQVILHAALSDKALQQSGQYFAECMPMLMPFKAWNEKFCEDIWRDSEKFSQLLEEEKLDV